MNELCDTNIFLRLAEKNSPLRTDALRAVRSLRAASAILCYTPQVVAEFWNVCTRPQTARGGFGLTLEATERKARLMAKHFRLLPDSVLTFEEWQRLVITHRVTGVAVHDAKLVASMNVHNITRILTFNTADFARYSFITAVDPRTL